MYRRDAARRESAKAIHSGTAVSASATLCTESASSATDPLAATTSSWSSAVTPSTARLIFTARMPWLLPRSAESTESALSWLCRGSTEVNAAATPARQPE